MKHSRKSTRRKASGMPELRFETQRLTSFAGLVVIQAFLARIGLGKKLARCFEHARNGSIYGRSVVFLQLVIHLMLGYRDLRDSVHYRDDPMIKRLLGLRRLPDTSTMSRIMKETDERSIRRLRGLLRKDVLKSLRSLRLPRITLDFDGSVQSTKRHAEGTAVGFNKKKKGARSYYPLFCTISQVGQVFDFLHRSGNVHDSRGAREFMVACIEQVRQAMPDAVIEIRADSAFFSDELVHVCHGQGVEFTISVPFERFVELKTMIEGRRRWRRLRDEGWYFEKSWQPKSWHRPFRFIFIRQRTARQHKGPVQLDLFEPHEHGYEFKVVVTNKRVGAGTVLPMHEGRGSQEGIFGELKQHCAMDRVPVRRRLGNQMYLLAGLFAHNLIRRLQMETTCPVRGTTKKRSAMWEFEQVGTFRKNLLQRAGRLTRPAGRLTLTVSANQTQKSRLLKILKKLPAAA